MKRFNIIKTLQKKNQIKISQVIKKKKFIVTFKLI